ncbi:nickel pincer cofactor biosynthesis protein LarC [bacterium]|nr:nickel pincer cofactor biosynthesis protein LarC [candidate division CSSED10-310 bacterium]
MKILHLQCYAGISGDMFLGALLDAGLNESELRDMLSGLGIKREEVVISKVIKKGINAISLKVYPDTQRHHLHVEDIRSTINDSGLKPDVIKSALAVFERIVAAESEVHGVSMEKVHLHEVSGLDTIVDILGVAWGLNRLGIDRIHSTPINTGSGTVSFSHGVVPVPAPATAILLTGIPVMIDDLPGERTTPTGAALAAEFIDSFDPPGTIRPICVGYGAGERDDGDRANVLRAMICESDQQRDQNCEPETLTFIETDIDDDTPELIAFLTECLITTAGVLDVSVLSTCRKKNRVGHLIRVLCRPDAVKTVRELIFRESSTLGVREWDVRRYRQLRQVKSVQTRWGMVRVVCSNTHLAPEYEDCRRCAETAGVPLRQVYTEAIVRLQTGS